MEELIRSFVKFGGTRHEDVVKWLQDMEEIFDRVPLRPSNKFIVAQSYLTKTAATWFRFNKSNIPDWSTFQLEIVKAFQLSTPSKISLTPIIPQKAKENENNQADLINDNQIKSFEDLEDNCLREHEQSHYSPISVSLNDPRLKIQPQCLNVDDYDEVKQQGAHVVNDSDKLNLEQQGEFVIKSGSAQTDAEDAFEAVVSSSDSLACDDTLINTVVPQNVQYLWSDKYRSRKPRIFNKVYIGYDWNQYNKKHYDIDTPTSYEDITFTIVSKAWAYSYNYGFRCYFQNGIFQRWFYLRKWKYRRRTVSSDWNKGEPGLG